MDAKAIAIGTLAALENGQYVNPYGVMIDIVSQRDACVNNTRAYLPEELSTIRDQVMRQRHASYGTKFFVINETTLQCCADLARNKKYQRIMALNFASAKNPGGGFLNGARAQEESLARSSALYDSLRQCPQHYAFHRSMDTCLYSDRMIYSPNCPIIRDEGGNWLAEPYLIDFITSPAPNAGVVMRNEPSNRDLIIPVLTERASKILALALHHGCEALVLGAWGCGVFQNNPEDVAAAFHQHLSPSGAYAGRFRQVVFAVFDTSKHKATLAAFANQFADLL